MMKTQMLINATAEVVRVAVLKDRILHQLHVEHIKHSQRKGNIYRGKVVKIEPAIQAAFVDYGESRHGFLPVGEITHRWYAHQPKDPRHPGIGEILARDHELLLQVVRDESGNKGAAMTTRISLPGRYVVLLPYGETGGVSRKIDDDKQRKRLKEVQRKLAEKAGGHGVIVRTVGMDRTKAELERDLAWLLRLWNQIEKAFSSGKGPGLIFKEQDVVLRSLRDYYTTDVDEVLIDDAEAFERVMKYVQQVMPRQKRKFQLYDGSRPLFGLYDVEGQIAKVYRRQVPLASGGALVIDPTEALVAVDVNSGRSMQEKGVEATALRTNLEAAREVARQLRLRDLGGLVVVDFIDMREAKHRREVERALAQEMKTDKARHKIGKIDEFGVLVMSRQRLRQPHAQARYVTCPMCHGRAVVRSVESLALDALRRIELAATSSSRPALVKARVPEPVAMALLNERKDSLVKLEDKAGCRIEIHVDPSMGREDDAKIETSRRDPRRAEDEPAHRPEVDFGIVEMAGTEEVAAAEAKRDQPDKHAGASSKRRGSGGAAKPKGEPAAASKQRGSSKRQSKGSSSQGSSNPKANSQGRRSGSGKRSKQKAGGDSPKPTSKATPAADAGSPDAPTADAKATADTKPSDAKDTKPAKRTRRSKVDSGADPSNVLRADGPPRERDEPEGDGASADQGKSDQATSRRKSSSRRSSSRGRRRGRPSQSKNPARPKQEE